MGENRVAAVQDKSTKKSIDIKITKKQPKRKQFKKNKLQY